MMSEEEFRRIAFFMKSRYGIDMSHKKEIMTGRLENYVRAGGWDSYWAYMNEVEMDMTRELENVLVNMLTTNHTFFMREAEHFEYLRQVILPELRKSEAKEKDLCIWCGAASTGEEPYTIAMILKDFFGLEHESWDTKVLATDISEGALATALAGQYTKEQVEVLPKNWRRRYFHTDERKSQCTVTPELKKEVLFRKFNLMDPFPFKRKMHIVFMRNVMIYFDEATKTELIHKIYEVMEPGGYLFIGQAEALDRKNNPFHMIQPSIFRK